MLSTITIYYFFCEINENNNFANRWIFLTKISYIIIVVYCIVIIIIINHRQFINIINW